MAEFSYTKINDYWYPVLPFKIKCNIKALPIVGLLDSGALIHLFTKSIADNLGLDVEKGRKEELGGISGKIEIFIHDLEFEVEGKKFICPVAFSKNFSADLNIIGRLGFFEHFEITFDDKNKKFRIR